MRLNQFHVFPPFRVIFFPLMLSGVRVVAGAVGNLPSVLDSHQLGTALGGLEDVDDMASSDCGDDGDESISSGGETKVDYSLVETRCRLLSFGTAAPVGLSISYSPEGEGTVSVRVHDYRRWLTEGAGGASTVVFRVLARSTQSLNVSIRVGKAANILHTVYI